MDLTDLPNDIFLIVISHLTFQDCVKSRTVSKAWRLVFSENELSLWFLKHYFPRCREVRGITSTAEDGSTSTEEEWATVFAQVARRYHHLQNAKPHSIEKVRLFEDRSTHHPCTAGQQPPPDDTERFAQVFPVAPWRRFLRHDNRTARLVDPETLWAYSKEDGMVAFLDRHGRIAILDLDSRREAVVPFDPGDRTTRRLRLACGVLIVEWCESKPYHRLNEREDVHRHFATAFDIGAPPKRNGDPEEEKKEEEEWLPPPRFRSEWKIHFLGMPVNQDDRFFSVHNSTHYALYIWQPNRSPWGDDDPLEQLIVFDISSPSPYRPSSDPTGCRGHESGSGPRELRRLTWRELEFYGLRQRHTPTLRELLLDGANVYVHAEDHPWAVGDQASLSPPRLHCVRSTGIPFQGVGPCWYDECGDHDDVHMSFCPRLRAGPSEGIETMAWGHSSSSGYAPCWRHENFPWLNVSQVVDERAGVKISARYCLLLAQRGNPSSSKAILFQTPAVKNAQKGEKVFAYHLWAELMSYSGRIQGDERWILGQDAQGRLTIMTF